MSWADKHKTEDLKYAASFFSWVRCVLFFVEVPVLAYATWYGGLFALAMWGQAVVCGALTLSILFVDHIKFELTERGGK